MLWLQEAITQDHAMQEEGGDGVGGGGVIKKNDNCLSCKNVNSHWNGSLTGT